MASAVTKRLLIKMFVCMFVSSSLRNYPLDYKEISQLVSVVLGKFFTNKISRSEPRIWFHLRFLKLFLNGKIDLVEKIYVRLMEYFCYLSSVRIGRNINHAFFLCIGSPTY